jgi:hypothetical protein
MIKNIFQKKTSEQYTPDTLAGKLTEVYKTLIKQKSSPK